MTVGQLAACNSSIDFAVSFNFRPLVGDVEQEATHYKLRYAMTTTGYETDWTEQPAREKGLWRCPGDPCNRLCGVIFNLNDKIDMYTVQVR